MGTRRDGRRGWRIDGIHHIGGLVVDGSAEFGANAEQAVVIRASGSVRHVNDEGMEETPGTTGELVYNEDDATFYACSAGDEVAATWVPQKLAGALEISGDVTVAEDANVHGDADCRQNMTVQGAATIGGNAYVEIAGDVTLGASVSDQVVAGGVFLPRWLGSDPATSPPAGVLGELAYYGGKAWVCVDETVGSEVWDPLN